MQRISVTVVTVILRPALRHYNIYYENLMPFPKVKHFFLSFYRKLSINIMYILYTHLYSMFIRSTRYLLGNLRAFIFFSYHCDSSIIFKKIHTSL